MPRILSKSVPACALLIDRVVTPRSRSAAHGIDAHFLLVTIRQGDLWPSDYLNNNTLIRTLMPRVLVIRRVYVSYDLI